MTMEEAGRAPRVRILIAEDQALVRRGTAVLLSMEPDMEVVGQACESAAARQVARQRHKQALRARKSATLALR